LPDGEDWLFAPVHAQMIKGESLIDGSVDLAYVALLNDSLAVRHDNEELVRRKADAEKPHVR
jgi:hypothetical protein